MGEVDDSKISLRPTDEIGMERLDPVGPGEHVSHGRDCFIEAKQLAFLGKEIVGGMNGEKYFCELLNKA